jgi:hypothetical protein
MTIFDVLAEEVTEVTEPPRAMRTSELKGNEDQNSKSSTVQCAEVDKLELTSYVFCVCI